jgi:very-short-patch-repair endonuclease
MTETPPDLLTAAGFLTERQDLLYVYVVKSRGEGWDVVVRIDGSYHDRSNAEDAAVDIREWMTSLTDVGMTERYWWGGPPWR